MTLSFEEYLGQIESYLHPLDPSRRAELLLELRCHLEDTVIHLATKEEDEDERVQSAIAWMGPPDEIGRGLVKADRPRSGRNALFALLPYALLALAGIVDFKTTYNHSFVTVVLLLSLGVTLYFWGQPNWPTWSTSWASFASVLPLAITENGQNGSMDSLFVITLFFPLAAFNFFRQQSLRHALLSICGAVWVSGFIVLRVSQFSLGLVAIGAIPVMIGMYIVRRYKKYSSGGLPMQMAQ